MAELLQATNEFLNWFISTDLPEATATATAKIIEFASNTLVPLMYQYIDVLFN